MQRTANPFNKAKFSIFLIIAIFHASLISEMAHAAGMTPLSGHVSALLLSRAQHIGRKSAQSRMRLALTLAPTDPQALQNTLKKIYDPSDPHYHQFITPDQFANNYGASSYDIAQVTQYLSSRNLQIIHVHPNGLVIDVEGATSDVENAFQTEIHDYLTPDGRLAYSPISEPLVQAEIAPKIVGIAGLGTLGTQKKHLKKLSGALDASNASINSYLTPANFHSTYNLSSLTQNGTGQSIALFELDGYTPSDIAGYTSYFSIATPTLVNEYVDGVTGATGDGADEVTLDIELVAAVAPASTIYVYEGPNTDAGLIDVYSKIATDNKASVVSTSWGQSENEQSTSTMNSENVIFEQLAAQGQTIFAAAGDSGAYDDSSNNVNALEVDDPASQPYVTAAGGTTMYMSASGGFGSESSWGTPAANGNPASGGGGGISEIWGQPTWQNGLSTNANLGSNAYRMVPDVSLDANPSTGYPVYFHDATDPAGFYAFGGTSCAAPLWAAMAALVNQQRVAEGLPVLGFANPSLYQIAQSSLYSTTFHDTNDASTNLHYPAVTGYDLSTGWGSFNGAGLFSALTSANLPPYPPSDVSAVLNQ